MLEKREFDRSDFMWRVSAMVALTSGIFSVIVFTLLLVHYVQLQVDDPVDNEMLPKLRALYASLPEEDPELAERIQYLDLMTRRAIFTSQFTLNVGGIMLLSSVCIFLLALKTMSRYATEKPELGEKPQADIEWEAIQVSRPYLVWTGVGILILGLGASYLSQQRMDALQRGELIVAKEAAGPAIEFPDWEAMQTQWPSFRGPGGLGIAHFTTAPETWDIEAGTGVKWKIEVPLEGTNSPVVWDDRLYLAGATEDQRQVYCFNTETGELRWTYTLERFPGSPVEPPNVTDEVTFAPCTLAVHGDYVFALYPTGDMVALDAEGELVWGKNVGIPDNHYGHSSSLLAYDNYVYVQFDDNVNPRLIALNAADGSEAWKAGDRSSISWASPALAETEYGMQLLLASSQDVTGYDPVEGTQLWFQECLGGEVGPSPAYAGGMVFVANEYAVASAIKLNQEGETITPEIVWEYDYLLPEVSSPIGDGEHFYMATSVGEIVCLRAEDGEELWAEEMGIGFYSSPILVGDKIYAVDMEGTMFIARAGAEAEILAELPLGEDTLATPAFLDGRMYVRTLEHLLCIERPNTKNSSTMPETEAAEPVLRASAGLEKLAELPRGGDRLAASASPDGQTYGETAEPALRIERANAANS